MSTIGWIAIAAGALLIAAIAAAIAYSRRPALGVQVKLIDPEGPPGWEHPGGAARSVQAAEIRMPRAALEQLWSAVALERLARTYWRFLTRATLGLIRIVYSDQGRAVVFLAAPIVLIGFDPPEYELDAERGLVRWRIRRGLLVSRRGRSGDGSLVIEVRRQASPGPELAQVEVEVAVLSFYPSIAAIGRRIYAETQARIHVIVTHAFLRSLARLDLAESRTGQFAAGAPATPGDSSAAAEDGG